MPRVYNSIIVAAPLDMVWSRIRDFYDFSWAPSLVESCEAVGEEQPTAVGARRLINGAFLDTLITHSDHDHRIQYSIDDAPSPMSPKEISNYVGDLHLLAVTNEGKTFAEWTGTWDSESSEGVDFMNQIYVSLLGDLKKEFEA